MTDEPVKSTEKVRALLQDLPQRLAGRDDPRLQMAAGAWPMLQPLVAQLLPNEPAELDRALEQLAITALRARSDDARAFIMRTEAGDVQAQWLDVVLAQTQADDVLDDGEPEPTPVPIETAPASEFDDVGTEPMGPTPADVDADHG